MVHMRASGLALVNTYESKKSIIGHRTIQDHKKRKEVLLLPVTPVWPVAPVCPVKPLAPECKRSLKLVDASSQLGLPHDWRTNGTRPTSFQGQVSTHL